MIRLAEIERALAAHEAHELPAPRARRDLAAVSLVLGGPPDDPVMCFIRRADRHGDRWSGHMAFPGGRASPADAGPREVAIRETREEVGLALDPGDCIGALSQMPVSRQGHLGDGVLSPFVFRLAGPPARLSPEPGEVAAAYWIPVAHLWEARNHTRLRRRDRTGERVVPGIRYRREIIWGLTYRVLDAFARVLRVPLGSEAPRPADGEGRA